MLESSPAVDAVLLRQALGLFASGVTVICAAEPASGEVRGMTANAFMSGSLTPPLIMVSVRHQAHMHAMITESGAYGVSILPEGLEREARRFAGMPVAAHEPGPRFQHLDGVPFLEGALCSFTARVASTHEIGDHTLFIGEVFGVDLAGRDQPALGYYRSRFTKVEQLDGSPVLPIDQWSGAFDAWG